jgi:protein-disulfide isomerase
MGHPKQNLPRAFRQPLQRSGTRPDASRLSGLRWAQIVGVLILAAIVGTAVGFLLRPGSSQAASEHRIDREVTKLLTGIPQHQSTLGRPTAPVTLQVFIDLKDPDSRSWFLTDLPAIIHDYVRTGTLKLEYRAYKTNTHSPQEFVKDQTAALAAGAQNKLWNFIYTFFHEQGSEFVTYATENYIHNIARQVPGLSLAQWQTDRHTGRREEQTTAEDQTARTLRLHVTPSFRIGLTGGPLHNYAGHSVIKYGEQHPIALPEASDIAQAINELDRRRGLTYRWGNASGSVRVANT